MALPVQISGVNQHRQMKSNPPHISLAGNVYAVLPDETTVSDLDVHKATDPTSSFSQQSSVSLTNEIRDVSSITFQNKIHIATIHDAGNGLRYHVYDMATDSFTTSNENTGAAINTSLDATQLQCSIKLRSGGVPIIAYSGAVDTI